MKDKTKQIASNVQSNMMKNGGIFVPPGLLKNIPVECSLDDIDAKVDTSDGHNTFHGTAICSYRCAPKDSSGYISIM